MKRYECPRCKTGVEITACFERMEIDARCRGCGTQIVEPIGCDDRISSHTAWKLFKKYCEIAEGSMSDKEE